MPQHESPEMTSYHWLQLLIVPVKVGLSGLDNAEALDVVVAAR
jgi:hypothetical protein